MKPLQPNTDLEDIILSSDRRFMSALRAYLPPDFCMRAAQLAFAVKGTVLITTGFYLVDQQGPETDGPPGALAIGRALTSLGARVVYITDPYCDELIRSLAGTGETTVCFPITGEIQSRQFADTVLARLQPELLISVERCGQTAGGRYLNARGMDISAYTARVDALFQPGLPSIGIGDGGNEIGMGKLAHIIPTIPGLPAQPAVCATRELIISSVSNWGAYGLVAGLSLLSGHDLLPELEIEQDLLCKLPGMGCYNATNPAITIGVDGFTLAENLDILTRLHNWLASQRS